MFESRFSIGGLPFGGRGVPVLISETACAHDGSLDELKRLIDASAEATADVIQLQVFRASHQVPPHHKIRSLLDRIELSDSDWASAFSHARSTGAQVMAFVYDIPSLEVALANEVVALKLNSADLLNRPLLVGCAKSGLPIFLGTGASTTEEIGRSLDCIAEHGGSKVILMHGVQDFPTALKDARIDRIRLLQSVFGMPVGYGDHTDGSLPISRVVDLVALGLGVNALEKHITMSRAETKPDYQAALEPKDWAQWASLVREAATAFSAVPPVGLTEADHRYRRFQKKYAVAARDLAIGETLDQEAVRFLRLEQDGEVSSLDFADMGLVKITRALSAYEMIRKSDLVQP